MIKNHRSGFILGSAIFIIDRLTKLWAVTTLSSSDILLTPYLSFSLTYNTGIAWSLLSHQGWLVKNGLVFVSIYFLYYLWNLARERAKKGFSSIGEIVIISAGLSNIVDRYIYKGVVDFIKISWGDYTFPYFNIADISICIAIVFLLYYYWHE